MQIEQGPIAAGVAKFASLKVAAEDKTIPTVKKETIFQLDPFEILIRPNFNRPISREHIEEIKEALRGGAVIPPVDVAVYRTAERSVIYMVDGEHRMWAVRELIEEFRAGLETGRDIQFMSAIEFKGDLAEQYAHMLGSAKKLGIDPLVFGEKCMELIALKWDVARIAQRLARSKTHIENSLMLARAPFDVKEAVRAGKVAFSVAVDLVREHGEDAGKVIQGVLVKVQAKGKTKVTRQSVHGRALPRKLVTRATASIDFLFDNIKVKPDELAAMDDAAEVPVDARMLKDLLAIRDEVAKLRAQADEKKSDSDETPGSDAI